MSKEHSRNSVAIAAQEPLLGYGVRRLLEAEANLKVVAEAANISAAVRAVLESRPDLLLLDLEMPPSGLDVLTQLCSAKAPVRTLLLAYSLDRKQIAAAFELGARGFVMKGSDTRMLVNSVRSVMAGRYWVGEKPVSGRAEALRNFSPQRNGRKSWRDYKLTARELEIIVAIANGCSNKDASEKFSITERTVKHHLTNIFDKLGLSSRLELALFAVNNHWDSFASEAHSSEFSPEKYAEAP